MDRATQDILRQMKRQKTTPFLWPYECIYCNTRTGSYGIPKGWGISFFRPCGDHQHFCSNPACRAADEAAAAKTNAAWEAPEVNREYKTQTDWLNALVPLLCIYGDLQEGQTIEYLDTELHEELVAEFKAGKTPAQGYKQNIANLC